MQMQICCHFNNYNVESKKFLVVEAKVKTSGVCGLVFSQAAKERGDFV